MMIIKDSRCPKCSSEIEYDGNYWCSDEDCNWVLPDSPRSFEDKNAFVVAYVLLMQQTGREPLREVVDSYIKKISCKP